MPGSEPPSSGLVGSQAIPDPLPPSPPGTTDAAAGPVPSPSEGAGPRGITAGALQREVLRQIKREKWTAEECVQKAK